MDFELQTKRAADVWSVLARSAEQSQTITYKELSNEISVHVRPLRYALVLVQQYCLDNDLPHLTALVVNSSSGLPGAGNMMDPAMLQNEYARIYSFNWSGQSNPFAAKETDAIDAWWIDEPSERFWIESTDRKDIGQNLLAPISSNGYHKLVSMVEDGDLILHYFQPARAIVAFSIASGNPFESTLRWPDREHSPEASAYQVNLSHYTELEEPISLKQIQSNEPEIRLIKAGLDTQLKKGQSAYFPYQVPASTKIQPAQGAYLTKLPKVLLELFPQIDEQMATDIAPEVLEITSEQKTSVRSLRQPQERKASTSTSGYGRQTDEAKKKATELYAMTLATEFLVEQGYVVEDVSSQRNIGYDLRALKADEIIGVEVKGSTIQRIQIDLTINEVEYALLASLDSNNFRSLLFLVEGIEGEKVGADWIMSGGNARHWWDWNPEEQALTPTAFRFTLPISK
jgi:hypothetical protein